MIPSIPYKIETTMRVGPTVRRETRNATSLAQAVDTLEREMRKPATRRCEISIVIDSRDKHGGPG